MNNTLFSLSAKSPRIPWLSVRKRTMVSQCCCPGIGRGSLMESIFPNSRCLSQSVPDPYRDSKWKGQTVQVQEHLSAPLRFLLDGGDFFFLRKNEQEKYWCEVCILTLWTRRRSLWGDGIFCSQRRRLKTDNSRHVLISFCSRFAIRPIMWQSFYCCPCFVLDGQHASQSFFFFFFFGIFPLWPHERDGAQKKAADVNKIFICQKDFQLNITTFHFKNQLDSSKSCSRRGGGKNPRKR